MRHIISIWICYAAFLIGENTPLNNFYKSIEQNLILKMEIKFFQNQFGNTISSSGAFYLAPDKKYLYDSYEIKMIVEDSLITTINYETRQLVYSSVDKDHLSILDILSGKLDNIQFLDKTNKYTDHFEVQNLGYRGTFEFDKDSGLLKLVRLHVDDDQSLKIEIKSIDFVKNYEMSIVDNENFEVIDLRD
tara:strand:+ start:783 stop:1352 length:570 start_codon:yes stop_codon:yes gene_type:complete